MAVKYQLWGKTQTQNYNPVQALFSVIKRSSQITMISLGKPLFLRGLE
jgi:hypothetical protein